ncbi:MAG TPA: hypothetical protein VM619_01070 [Luteimonas sp.]|nr:hypothetical protein [Luteimonas sp.]
MGRPGRQHDGTPPARPSLLRRCALGIWLCGIALMGVVEFRRAALAGDTLAMTPIAWMWFAGSTVTAVAGIALVLRELLRDRGRRPPP